MTNNSRKVVEADYSRQDGVKVKGDCGHWTFIPGFPRSDIPDCFRFSCNQCLN